MNKNMKLFVLVGLGGVGVYLIWKGGYLAQWLPSVFGPTKPATPVTGSTASTTTASTASSATGSTTQTNKSATPPALDVTGLVVTPDINDSLAGTVKIHGVPTRLAIIQSDGRIFDGTGSEVSDKLTATGVDLHALRAAFGISGMAGMGWIA